MDLGEGANDGKIISIISINYLDYSAIYDYEYDIIYKKRYIIYPSTSLYTHIIDVVT